MCTIPTLRITHVYLIKWLRTTGALHPLVFHNEAQFRLTTTLEHKRLSADSIGASCAGEETQYSLPHWFCWEGEWPAFQLPLSPMSPGHICVSSRPLSISWTRSHRSRSSTLIPTQTSSFSTLQQRHKKRRGGLCRQIDAIQNPPFLTCKGWL